MIPSDTASFLHLTTPTPHRIIHVQSRSDNAGRHTGDILDNIHEFSEAGVLELKKATRKKSVQFDQLYSLVR